MTRSAAESQGSKEQIKDLLRQRLTLSLQQVMSHLRAFQLRLHRPEGLASREDRLATLTFGELHFAIGHSSPFLLHHRTLCKQIFAMCWLFELPMDLIIVSGASRPFRNSVLADVKIQILSYLTLTEHVTRLFGLASI